MYRFVELRILKKEVVALYLSNKSLFFCTHSLICLQPTMHKSNTWWALSKSINKHLYMGKCKLRANRVWSLVKFRSLVLAIWLSLKKRIFEEMEHNSAYFRQFTPKLNKQKLKSQRRENESHLKSEKPASVLSWVNLACVAYILCCHVFLH